MRATDNTARSRITVLFVLALINFANYFDRSLVGIMAENIKRDLGLSDGELGLSTSVAFFVTYSLFALPIARMADGGGRKRVVLGSIAIWSTMTFFVGWVRNFWQLAACRVGVALGEAGILPASLSTVSTEFGPRRSGTVISILWVGSILGAAAAPLAGGWMLGLIGWRHAFTLVGVLSLLLVPLALAVLPGDPTEGKHRPAGAHPATKVLDWIRDLRSLFARRTYVLLWIGSALMFAAPNALNLYTGPFLIRTFGLGPVAAGAYLSVAFGPPMICGTLIGGWLFDRLRRRSLALALMAPGAGVILGCLIAVFGLLNQDALKAVLSLGMTNLCFGLMASPGYAAAQELAPSHLKSSAAATFNLGSSLVGASAGTLLTGYLSDALLASSGVRSLGYGLIGACAVTILGSVVMIISGVSAARDSRSGIRPSTEAQELSAGIAR